MNQNYTVKLYDCKICKATMMSEVFADEKTTLEMMKQNPYCEVCGDTKNWCPELRTKRSSNDHSD